MAKEKIKSHTTHVSIRKKDLVKDLVELMKKNNTFLIASVKDLPSKQFQAIRKKVRESAEIRVPKKSSFTYALDSVDKTKFQELKGKFEGDCAVLFSNLDAFELSGILSECRSATKAKAGQIAPEDIVIEAGPTDLVPGPAISELGSVGLKTKVKDGKIEISENKTIVKKGEAINQKVAGIMDKLGVAPFTVGFESLVAYDKKENKIYAGIRINKAEVLASLIGEYKKALGFAINVGYPTKETITYSIWKAALEEKAFETITSHSSQEENKSQGEA